MREELLCAFRRGPGQRPRVSLMVGGNLKTCTFSQLLSLAEVNGH